MHLPFLKSWKNMFRKFPLLVERVGIGLLRRENVDIYSKIAK